MMNIFSATDAKNEQVMQFLAKKGKLFQKMVGAIKYLDFRWEQNKVPEDMLNKETRQKLFDFIENGRK